MSVGGYAAMKKSVMILGGGSIDLGRESIAQTFSRRSCQYQIAIHEIGKIMLRFLCQHHKRQRARISE
jgi:hypothetical protein